MWVDEARLMLNKNHLEGGETTWSHTKNIKANEMTSKGEATMQPNHKKKVNIWKKTLARMA